MRYRFTLPDKGWVGFLLPLVDDECLVVLLSVEAIDEPRFYETPQ
jgi:hypothetical protein